MGRSIGLDVHRDFCEVAIADGGRARSAGRIATDPEQIELFAGSLGPDDRVVLEATGNALAIARILEPHVAEVVLAHAKDVRAISHARVKTDKIDARVLADLLAAGLIPQVWIGDERCRMVGLRPELGDVLRDLDRLQEVAITKDGREMILRTPATGVIGPLFKAARMALPPNIRDASAV